MPAASTISSWNSRSESVNPAVSRSRQLRTIAACAASTWGSSVVAVRERPGGGVVLDEHPGLEDVLDLVQREGAHHRAAPRLERTRPSTSSRSSASRTGVRLSPISWASPASVITAPAG